MATWKKVLTEDSSVNLSQLVTSSNQVLISDGNGAASGATLGSNQIIIGNGSSVPTVTTPTGGDVVGTLNADGNFHLNIGSAKVDHAAMADDAIEIQQIADSDAFAAGSAVSGLLVFGDGTTAKTPHFLSTALADAGKRLAVNSGGNGFEFVSAASAADVDVNSSAGTAAVAVLFGAANDGNDDGSGVQVLKQTNANEFTYKPDVSTYAVGSDQLDFAGTAAATFTPAGTTHALTVAGGIKGHLAGTAAAATRVNVAESAADGFYSLVFADISSGAGYKPLGYDNSGLTYNPAEETLKVKNLQVTGTNVSVDTTNLLIEDHTIRLGSSAASTTAADAEGTGFVVNIGISDITSGEEDSNPSETNVDGFLPRVIWGDEDRSESTLGWQIAHVGADDLTAGQEIEGVTVDANLKTASTAYGVAVLKHVTDDITAASALNTAGANAHDIGVGAFFLAAGGNGNLYIQTA